MSPLRSEHPRITDLNWKEVIGTILVVVVVNLAAVACAFGMIMGTWMVSERIPPTPEPWQKRKMDPAMIHRVEPREVKSTWRFEPVYAPRWIHAADLAIDSMDRPHIAYGGDRLYYAWFDGSAWQHEIPDDRLGAGMEIRLILDANDRPHFFYSAGDFDHRILVHGYRDAAGWQHETIDNQYCMKQLHDAVLEPGGTLAVLISGSTICNESSIYNNHVWLLQQTADGWRTGQVTDSGLEPSLAYDRDGRAHIVYNNPGMGEVYEAVQANGRFAPSLLPNSNLVSGRPLVCFDTSGVEHILFSSDSISNYANGTQQTQSTLGHAWLADSGWQFETIGEFSPAVFIQKTYIDGQGRVSFFYKGTEQGISLARWEVGGWEMTPDFIDTPNDGLTALDIDLDSEERPYLISVDTGGVLRYMVQQGDAWQATEIDRGNHLDRLRVALAFNQDGGLAATFASDDGALHYLWQEEGAWQEEPVGSVQGSDNDSIYLSFDQENQPHIFYLGRPTPIVKTNTFHLFRDNNRWTTEALPVNIGGFEIVNRPAISPEGWWVFFNGPWIQGKIDLDLAFVYGSPSGWQDQAIPGYSAWISDKAMPQIAYSPKQAPSNSQAGGIAIPAVVYSTQQTHEVAYFDPATNKEVILPILDNQHDATHYALGFNSSGQPVIFFTAEDIAHGGIRSMANVYYVTQTAEGWQAYQIGDIRESTISTRFLDRQGWAHITSGFRYLTGSGSDWKITQIQGQGQYADIQDIQMVGQSLNDETGDFCTIFFDYIANDLIIGCLENIE